MRRELLKQISRARAQSDGMFSCVSPDAIYDRPIPERHRLVFYVGHLEAFDWNLLRERALGAKSFHPEFDRLFAFGIDPVDGDLPDDRPDDYPRLEAVQAYVKTVRATLDQKLEWLGDSDAEPSDSVSLDLLLGVAVEHRLMHVETLAYLLHQLPYQKKSRGSSTPSPVSAPVVPEMVDVTAGVATLGLARDAEAFGWDNEYEAHAIDVPSFAIDRFMVTNRQYLEFLAAGGYEERSFWSEAGWNWRCTKAISQPVFWQKLGDAWLYRSMFEAIPLPLDWPVYVSHAEASAYARWAGKSLPTEAEWHRAAYGGTDADLRSYPWGNAPPAPSRCNAGLLHWDPMPVHALPRGQSAFGVQGMLGNGWEWTATPFAPFQGFRPFPFYPGYSANFFDGNHFVMKGGSPRTADCFLRPTFRNWFQPHYQHVYAGFRCIRR
jgi:ergothioneine biosynthesis protein EgtB